MVKIIAVHNQKGGVGKTTTTTNVGFELARKGYKVLLADLDPQATLTSALGVTDPEVVICFHFSIFEPLETTELLLSIHNQWFIIQIKNKKQTLFQGKNPALSRILAF